MTRALILVVSLLLLLGVSVLAQDAKDSPAQAEYNALLDEAKNLHDKVANAYEAAKTEKDKQQVLDNYEANLPRLGARFLALAEKHPKDGVTFDALQRALTYSGKSGDGDKAADLILKNHFEKIDDQLIDRLGRSSAPATAKVLSGVAEKSKDRKIQASATFNLAQHFMTRAEADDAKPADAVKYGKEAEKLFAELSTEKYADVIGDRIEDVKKSLFAIRNLAIGRVAPDITGEDADGKKLKLSDFRGKVVVLDFWASWCPPCMAMVPHERELVKRLDGKPFVFLGVNMDDNKETLKKTQEKHEISWRSFFDGRTGPIGETWNIQTIPAIFVLDAKGVIRYKGVRGNAMDQAVETLLKEMGS